MGLMTYKERRTWRLHRLGNLSPRRCRRWRRRRRGRKRQPCSRLWPCRWSTEQAVSFYYAFSSFELGRMDMVTYICDTNEYGENHWGDPVQARWTQTCPRESDQSKSFKRCSYQEVSLKYVKNRCWKAYSIIASTIELLPEEHLGSCVEWLGAF